MRKRREEALGGDGWVMVQNVMPADLVVVHVTHQLVHVTHVRNIVCQSHILKVAHQKKYHAGNVSGPTEIKNWDALDFSVCLSVSQATICSFLRK